jgi:hypothetical protein
MKAQPNPLSDVPIMDSMSKDLDAYGAAVLPALLPVEQCEAIAGLHADSSYPRAFGTGTYRHFNYPMPQMITRLRTAFYSRLVPIANAWNERMELGERYPRTHSEFLQMCRANGQTQPTSMLMEHTVGQRSLLHQDLYGGLTFPLQVLILLSQPGMDFAGGEFVVTEQRPRMQTRPEVVSLKQGDAVVLAVSNRPVSGTRGTYRVLLRHGFSKVREGRQHALSVVFHDAAA